MTTSYRIWLDDGDDHDADERTAASPQDAAEAQAEHDHAARDGWEWSWPVLYLVEDVATGKRWRVEIERDMEPVFSAGLAVEVSG